MSDSAGLDAKAREVAARADQARADLATAQTAARDAEAHRDLVAGLLELDEATHKDAQEAERALEYARVAVEAARSRLRAAQAAWGELDRRRSDALDREALERQVGALRDYLDAVRDVRALVPELEEAFDHMTAAVRNTGIRNLRTGDVLMLLFARRGGGMAPLAEAMEFDARTSEAWLERLAPS